MKGLGKTAQLHASQSVAHGVRAVLAAGAVWGKVRSSRTEADRDEAWDRVKTDRRGAEKSSMRGPHSSVDPGRGARGIG